MSNVYSVLLTYFHVRGYQGPWTDNVTVLARNEKAALRKALTMSRVGEGTWVLKSVAITEKGAKA